MSNKILTKNRIADNTAPTTAQATLGEMAVNAYDGKVYVGTNIGLTNVNPGSNSTQVSWVGAPIKDQDDMSSDSATSLATQQSIKKYVDDTAAAGDVTLTSGKIWIGQVSDVKAEKAVSGDVLMSTLGVTTIQTGTIDSLEIVSGAIDLTHMSANSVDSDQYVDGSIDNAHLADNAVGLDEMASGTDGNIISYDANGDPVAVATGTDGQVLTSTGAGSPPAFEDAVGTITALNNATANELVTIGSTTTELDAESNLTFSGSALQCTATLTVGANDTGHDVIFYGATSGANMTWDESTDDLILNGAAGLDVDGTTNLDVTDIDGTLDVDGAVISLDSTNSLNIDNSNTSNGITIGTVTSTVPISIGHTTSEVTVNDNLTVTGDLTVSGTTTTVNVETVSTSSGVIFEGSTANAYETTLDVVNPTADQTHKLSNLAAGTYYIPALAAASTDAITATPSELNVLDGISGVTTTELNYIGDVTSAIQAQFTGKQASAADLTALSSCQSGAATALALLTSTEVAKLDGCNATTGELNLLDGATTAVNTSLQTADRFICNDNTVMKQVALSDLVTFLEDGSTSGFDVNGGTF